MSHLMTIASIIRDASALQRACTLLEWDLREEARPQLFYEQGPHCDYVVRPKRHTRSMGLQAHADGSYAWVMDSMDRSYAHKLGQVYNYAVLEAEAVLAGMAITDYADLDVRADGTLSLYLEVG
jgi:hypothetical protein